MGVCDADLVEESLTVGDTEMVLEAEAAGVPEADLVEVSLMLGVLLGVGLFDTEMVSGGTSGVLFPGVVLPVVL